MMIFLSEKNGNIHLKMCKSSIIKYLLYIAKVLIGSGPESGSGENFPHPDQTKKARIRNPAYITVEIDPKRYQAVMLGTGKVGTYIFNTF